MKSIKSSLLLLLWLILPGLGQAQDVKTFTVGEELDFLCSMYEMEEEDIFDGSLHELKDYLHEAVNKYIWHYLSGFNDNPQPDDLKAYFAKIENEMVAVQYWNYETATDKEDLIKGFRDAVSDLQAYADGRSDNYPAHALKDQLDSILGTAWMFASEGDSYEFWALAAYRFLQQMVRFCPDISLIADFVSNDGRLGIYDTRVHEYVYYPCFSPVFMLGDDGQWRVYAEDCFMPTKAYRIVAGSESARRYLLSKHGEFKDVKLDEAFYVRYFESHDEVNYRHGIGNDEYVEDFVSDISLWEGHRVLFDMESMTWKICVKKGEYYHQVPGTPVLKMIFEDDDPLFLLEGEN